jgi:alpha-1,3-rhamnosyl/mannosyltransferase
VTSARIALNLLWLRPGAVGGTESYATRLAAAVADLPAAERDVDLTLFALPAFAPAHPDLVRRWPTRVSPTGGRPKALRVASESTWLAARTAGFDLVHHLGGTIPALAPRPNVVTIHDLQYLDLPQFFSAGKRAYLGRVMPRSAHRARVVMTVSEFTRRSVIDHLGVSPARTAVVPHAVLPPPQPTPEALPPGLPETFFLLPAIAYPHKNHAVVIDALPHLAGAHLICTGLPWTEDAALRARADALGVGARFHQLGRVSDAALDALYRAAVGLVFPSRYEGFGAPVVEAMQRDCAVIASDTTALPEVVGDAGILLPPDDSHAWADAMSGLLDDEALRGRLVAAGRQRAQAFRPEVAARALVAAYHLALQS